MIRKACVEVQRIRATINRQDQLELRKSGPQSREFPCPCGIGDDGESSGISQTMLQGLNPEQDEERDRDRPELVDRDVAERCLWRLRQEDTDAIAMLNPMCVEKVGKPI